MKACVIFLAVCLICGCGKQGQQPTNAVATCAGAVCPLATPSVSPWNVMTPAPLVVCGVRWTGSYAVHECKQLSETAPTSIQKPKRGQIIACPPRWAGTEATDAIRECAYVYKQGDKIPPEGCAILRSKDASEEVCWSGSGSTIYTGKVRTSER